MSVASFIFESLDIDKLRGMIGKGKEIEPDQAYELCIAEMRWSFARGGYVPTNERKTVVVGRNLARTLEKNYRRGGSVRISACNPTADPDIEVRNMDPRDIQWRI